MQVGSSRCMHDASGSEHWQSSSGSSEAAGTAGAQGESVSIQLGFLAATGRVLRLVSRYGLMAANARRMGSLAARLVGRLRRAPKV